MPKVNFLIVALSISSFAHTQQAKIESLKTRLANETADTAKVDLLDELGFTYREAKKLDSSIMFYKIALELNEKINYSSSKQLWDLAHINYMLYETGNYTESIKYAVRNGELLEK